MNTTATRKEKSFKSTDWKKIFKGIFPPQLLEFAISTMTKDGETMEQKISILMCLVPAYDRFLLFLILRTVLSGGLYWHSLRESYQNSDDLYTWRNIIRMAFESDQPNRDALMNAEEQKSFKALPETVIIYRGMTIAERESEQFGVSWSLSKEVATFFSNEYTRNVATKNLPKCVHTLAVPKNHLIALFQEREESEVIYLRNSLSRL